MLLVAEGFDYGSVSDFINYVSSVYYPLDGSTNYWSNYLAFGTGRGGFGQYMINSTYYGGNASYGTYCRFLEGYNVNSATEVVLGFAFYIAENYAQYSDRRLASFCQSGSTNEQVIINLTTSNYLQIVDGSSGAVYVTAPYDIPMYTWVYLEVKMKCHTTQGYVEVYLNNELFMSKYNYNTNPRGTNGVLGIIYIFQPWRNLRIDDVYILDTTGSSPFNDRLGPIMMKPILPNADGTRSEFTVRSGGTSHYLEIDESTALDFNTSYVQTATDGAIDWYKFAAQSGSGLLAVQLHVTHYLVSMGNGRLYTGIANYAESSSIFQLGGLSRSNWDGFYKIFTTAPDGSAWDFTKLNDTQYGIKMKVGL